MSNTLGTLRAYRRMRVEARLGAEAVRTLQAARLRRVLREAYANVAFYRDLFDTSGITPADIVDPEDLAQLPLITKALLQAQDPASLTHRHLRVKADENSSGSGGRPFTVAMEAAYLQRRNARFLWGLQAAGYRPGDRLLLVTAPRGGRVRKPWLRWEYASIADPPERIWAILARFRPHILYGCTSTLRQMAEYMQSRHLAIPRLRRIITTAELLDHATRRFLEAVFDTSVVDFYGMTEMGLVAWQSRPDSAYALAEGSVLVEFVPIPKEPLRYRLVMTNLELLAMPFIRLDTGDIAVPAPGGSVCGRPPRGLERIEGRVVDMLKLRDGRRLSPYQVTCRLEDIRGLRRYRVIQEDYERFQIQVETTDFHWDEVRQAVPAVMTAIVGNGVEVAVTRVAAIEASPGRKFRYVESWI